MGDERRIIDPVGSKLLVVCAIGVLVGLGLCGTGWATERAGHLMFVWNILGALVFVVSVLGFVVTALSLIAINMVRRFRR